MKAFLKIKMYAESVQKSNLIPKKRSMIQINPDSNKKVTTYGDN